MWVDVAFGSADNKKCGLPDLHQFFDGADVEKSLQWLDQITVPYLVSTIIDIYIYIYIYKIS